MKKGGTPNERPIVAFLLGSGFSIPDGVKGVKEINERMSKIDMSEILIHTDMTAIFLNGQVDLNPKTNYYEKLFVQEFLKFYNENVLKPGDSFHYEVFYDYYSDFLRGLSNVNEIEAFVQKFNIEYVDPEFHPHVDARNRISDFNRTFNQLLASLLHKPEYFRDITTLNYITYDGFIQFIKNIIETHDVKIHSLNHDLLFEYLGRRHADLWQDFTDGYEFLGSNYYGSISFPFVGKTESVPFIEKSYFVKLSRFTNKFRKRIALFKLHGSIMNYKVSRIYSNQPGEKEAPRIRLDYGVNGVFEEIYDEKTSEYRFEKLWDEPDPDFLSGTTEKTRRYGEEYYKILFEHFKSNLRKADLLFVIGYGFQDPKINEYIEEIFLSRSKRMVVVGKSRPNTYILDKYNAIFNPNGITGLTKDDYKEFLSVLRR